MSVVVTGLLILAVRQEHNHIKNCWNELGIWKLKFKKKVEWREGVIFSRFVLILSLCG